MAASGLSTVENAQAEISRSLEAGADAVWAVLRSFDVGWHPDVADCTLLRTPNGALERVLSDTSGGQITEALHYLSDTDRVLRYGMRAGMAGVTRYAAEVRVAPLDGGCMVTWSADIEGPRAKTVAEGTRAVFETALAHLARALPDARAERLSKTRDVALQSGRAGALSFTHAEPASEGPLVVFLHGIGGQASNWDAQLGALGGQFRVAALNLRGYGDTVLRPDQTQVEDHCDDICALADHRGAARVVLVGLSMGSWLATSFAMRHPDRLAGLVLAGGCTGMSEASAEVRHAFLAAREAPLDQGLRPADFADAVVDVIAGPEAGPTVRAALKASMAAIPAATYRDALRCFTNPPERFDFARIPCPVLLVTGAHDRLAPPDEIRGVAARMLEAGLAAREHAQIRFEVLPRAGHVCNLEQPEAFTGLVRAFLGGLPGISPINKPTRAEKNWHKRQSILGAARAEFCAAGFGGASMDRLAQAAGVSKPTLYQYFGDKAGLFDAVLEEGRAQIVGPLLTREGTLVDRLWRFSWSYADFVLRPDMLSLARLVLGEAARRPDTARRYHESGPARALDGLAGFVAACNRAGELDAPDARLAANDLWSLILSGPRDAALHHVDTPLSEAELLRAIGHGLNVFLRAYSCNTQADQAELAEKVTETRAQLHA